MFPAGSSELDNPYLRILIASIHRCNASVDGYRVFRMCSSTQSLHVHWPDKLWTVGSRSNNIPLGIAATLIFALNAWRVRRAGFNVVLTLHNERPHESEKGTRGKLFEFLTRLTYAAFTDIIIMSERHRAAALEILRAREGSPTRVHLAEHFHYDNVFSVCENFKPRIDLENAVAEIQGSLCISIGQIRHYKRIPDLIKKFLAVAGSIDTLLIAGDCTNTSILQEVRAATNGDPRVRLLLRALSDQEVGWLQERADMAIYNFRDIFNSGSLLASLTAGLPVLAHRQPAVSDLLLKFPAFPIVEFTEEDFGSAFLEAKKFRRLIDAKSHLGSIAPDLIARKHLAAYSIQNY